MNDNNQFAEWVLRDGEVRNDDARFPMVYEDEDGDRAEFLLSDEDRIAERVDGRLTIYRGRDSGDIVGGSIKGVSKLRERLLTEFSGFAFCVREGQVELAIVFAAAMFKQTDEMLSMHYRSVYDKLRLYDVTSNLRISTGEAPADGNELCTN